jgi:hypothetical protein
MNISLLYNVFLGETSPLVAGRIDSQANEMGARRMENMFPMLAGGMRKRPGTWFDGHTDGDREARLIDWMLSDGTCVVLEITAGMTQAWREEGGCYAVAQRIDNPYTAEQLPRLHYAANADNIWIVHQDQSPMKLEWKGGAAVKSFPAFTGKDFTAADSRPGTVAFDAGRLCFAGTKKEPNRIYMSKAPDSLNGVDRYTDFTAGSNPADSIVIEENDMQGSRIQWLAANKRLLAATERATWNDTGEVPTPSSFDMNIIEYAGSCGLQAKGSKEIMVYAGRSGKTLRALVWNGDVRDGGYVDMDISEKSSHFFGAGIKDFAVADYPYPMLWIVTRDGGLVSCTVHVSAGMLAFARHPTDGAVEAVAVAPQRDGDVVFLAVKRGNRRNVEHIILEDLVNEPFEDGHYVDAGVKLEFAEPVTELTGLERFAGKTVRVFADGSVEPPVEVGAEGKALLQNAVRKAHVGLPYKAAFSPNERQIPANGTSLGKKRRIEKITLKTYKSLGGRAGTNEEKTTELVTRRFGGYVLGTPPEPYTGDIEVTVSGNIDTEGKLAVTHEEPCAFTLLALVERVAIMEA